MDDAPDITQIVKAKKIHVSAPCRVDMGGTLDLATFYVPLFGRLPSTFNLALDLRTHVRLRPFEEGRIRVSSSGLGEEEAAAGEAAYDGPLGMFFIAADEGGHGALGGVAGLFHEGASFADDFEAVLKRKGPGGGVGGELTEREACGGDRREVGQAFADQGEGDEAVQVEGRLAARGFRELVIGALEHDL